nr:hypothetical protein [Tanacetum cinerariifolium]
MSDSSNYSDMSDPEYIADIDMVMQLINEDQQMQGESSRRSRKAINRDRDIAEARLMADYFGPSPKHPDYYFRPEFLRKPDVNDVRKLYDAHNRIHGLPGMLCSIDCENNDLTDLNHSLLFDDLLDDITLVVPFEVNGVTFEKCYYLADGIYPQWTNFVKSFTVARDERNAVFKHRQESARKDIERAFGVLQAMTPNVITTIATKHEHYADPINGHLA